MSKLIVVGFPETHRALHVMSELWRVSAGLTADLDKAVVLSWDVQGKLIVSQNVNLSTGEGVRWGRFWGAFIRTTLLFLNTDQMAAAAKALVSADRALSEEASAADTSETDVKWWEEEICLPAGFLRDVGAIIQPGDSAIFALLRQTDYLPLIREVRRHGGTLLHAPLDEEQEARVNAFLAGAAPFNSPAGRE